MFWVFDQTNCSGDFELSKKDGITHFVIIESENFAEAIAKAEWIGIYFNGVDEGDDCPCCGDRWTIPDESDSSKIPELYGIDVKEMTFSKEGVFDHANKIRPAFMDEGFEVCVHFKDGQREWY